MANPTNVESFTFTVFYDYTDGDGNTITYQYASGDGQAGLDEAQRFYQEALAAIDAGLEGLSNVVIRYISTPQWTDWEQASA